MTLLHTTLLLCIYFGWGALDAFLEKVRSNQAFVKASKLKPYRCERNAQQ